MTFGPLLVAAAASALAWPAAAQSPTPAPSCTAKSAKPIAVNALAANPATYAGTCVRLKGFWRDFGFYPTNAEAGVIDALSIAYLDGRRVGLYLSAADLARAPKSPAAASVYGTAGACEALGDPSKLTGYCAYKPGAYVAVAGIELSR